jgi:hypothetical protein
MISGIYIDATTVEDTRLEATIEMTGNDVVGNDDLTEDAEEVNVNRVDQALELNFGPEQKANSKVNACVPGSFNITIELEEGFRMAWMPGNDIKLMVSSGKISRADDNTGIFDVTGEGGDDELIIDVAQTSGTNTNTLPIKFEPATGVPGENITLSAMILPVRRSDESFVYSDQLVVGTYVACTGETVLFPFITNMSGYDSGIAVINDSNVSGSCALNYGNMKLDDDEMEDLEMIDVEAKRYTAFTLSMGNTDEGIRSNPNYQGSLGVTCEFDDAHGYVFINNLDGFAQGYLVEGK